MRIARTLEMPNADLGVIKITSLLLLRIEFGAHPSADVACFEAAYSFFVHSPTGLPGVFFTLREVTPHSEPIGDVCVRCSAGHKRKKKRMRRFARAKPYCCSSTQGRTGLGIFLLEDETQNQQPSSSGGRSSRVFCSSIMICFHAFLYEAIP